MIRKNQHTCNICSISEKFITIERNRSNITLQWFLITNCPGYKMNCSAGKRGGREILYHRRVLRDAKRRGRDPGRNPWNRVPLWGWVLPLLPCCFSPPSPLCFSPMPLMCAGLCYNYPDTLQNIYVVCSVWLKLLSKIRENSNMGKYRKRKLNCI